MSNEEGEVKLTGLAAAFLVPSRDASKSDIILPKYIYVKDRDGRYLAQRSGPVYATLTFRSGDPDLSCVFEAIRSTGSWYRLNANGNHPVMRYYSGWYSSDYPPSKPSYHFILASGNQVYLKDNYGPSLFLSNDLNQYGAPKAHNYINTSSLMEIQQASTKNEITNVEYDHHHGTKVQEAQPVIALSTNVRNDSDSTASQRLTYSYEKWTVGTWNNTAGIEIGVKSEFKATTPFVTNAKFETSVSASSSHSWGGENGEKKTISSSTTVTVPPKKKARVQIIIRNAHIDVRFTYKQKTVWANGSSSEDTKSGVYTNVDSWHVDVVLDDWEDI